MNPALAAVTTGSTPRLRKRELFLHLGYEPHPGQVLVHRSRAPRRVLACGVRWGKSTCAAMEVVAALLEPRERSLGWCVAPTLSLTDQVFQRVRLAFHDRLAHRILESDERERRLVVRNLGGGISEVLAKTSDNPVGLLGAALNWVVVDEAARLKRSVWEQVIAARLLDRRGWALLLSTPQGVNWYWELVRRGEKGRDPDFKSWRSPTWENPHVDRELIEAERQRMSEGAFAQEYGGAFRGEEVQPCDTCGGPSSTIMPVLVLRGDEKPGNCPECAGLVFPDGSTAIMRSAGGPLPVKIRRMVGEPDDDVIASAVDLDNQHHELN